jgi:hypothetical protein
MIYQITVKGELDQGWSEWLGGILLSRENQADGSMATTLTVDASDQSTLFGILDRIRDLNLLLLSVTREQGGKAG